MDAVGLLRLDSGQKRANAKRRSPSHAFLPRFQESNGGEEKNRRGDSKGYQGKEEKLQRAERQAS